MRHYRCRAPIPPPSGWLKRWAGAPVNGQPTAVRPCINNPIHMANEDDNKGGGEGWSFPCAMCACVSHRRLVALQQPSRVRTSPTCWSRAEDIGVIVKGRLSARRGESEARKINKPEDCRSWWSARGCQGSRMEKLRAAAATAAGSMRGSRPIR